MSEVSALLKERSDTVAGMKMFAYHRVSQWAGPKEWVERDEPALLLGWVQERMPLTTSFPSTSTSLLPSAGTGSGEDIDPLNGLVVRPCRPYSLLRRDQWTLAATRRPGRGSEPDE